MHRESRLEPPTDEQLAAFRSTYQHTMATASEDCPGDEALAAMVVGELTSQDQAHLADHIVSCAACAAGYRTLRELHSEAVTTPTSIEAVSSGRSLQAPRRRRSGLMMLAAAAMILLAVAAFRFSGPVFLPPADDSALRSDSGGSDSEGMPVLPADGAVLFEVPTSLTWPSLVAATSYQVRLFDANAEPLWESAAVLESRVDLPPAIVDGLAVGQSYFWVVRPSGSVDRRELGPFWFEVGE